MEKKKNRYIKYLIYLGVTFGVTAVLSILSDKLPAFAEWYALHIYPAIQTVVSAVTGIFPFSVFELLIAAAVVYAIYVIVRCIYLVFRKRAKDVPIVLIRLLCVAMSALLIFEVNCGINYHRKAFSQYSGLVIEKESKETLIALCEELIAEANAIAGEVDTVYVEGYGELFSLKDTDERREAVIAMNRLGDIYPVLDRYYPKAKPVLCSIVMSYENITGVFSAFTIEANYNNHVPDYVKAYTICHELSHLTGFMREDEAGFIAYLACMESDNVNMRYSGIVNALVYVLNSVYSNCGGEIYTRLYCSMDPQIIRDYDYDRAYWKQFETPIAEVSDAVNNVYLQVNSQPEGVKSYGRMVDLLLAYYKQQ